MAWEESGARTEARAEQANSRTSDGEQLNRRSESVEQQNRESKRPAKRWLLLGRSPAAARRFGMPPAIGHVVRSERSDQPGRHRQQLQQLLSSASWALVTASTRVS